MGFTKKTWKNRIAEYINRRLLTNEDGSTNLVTVARDEGTISQEGDAFNAANMNDLEDRIEAEFNEINQSLTVNKIDLLIDDNKNCKFNCDGYKYLLICAANDSKIINVDLLKLIGSINLGFIRYSSESYIGTCSMNIKPTYITLHGFYNKGYSYSTYQVYGIK